MCLESVQRHESSTLRLILGMWGMGGIGKTTIAKAIYNKIGRNFEGKSFLAHIREVWEQDAGQVYLQEQLLFDIGKETNTKIRNTCEEAFYLKIAANLDVNGFFNSCFTNASHPPQPE